MEAVAPTRASALRSCSGRRRTDRSQEWGGRAAEKAPPQGQSWQVRVGEPTAPEVGRETTRLGHPLAPAVNTWKHCSREHTRQVVRDSDTPRHRQYPLPGTSRQTVKSTQDSPTDT